MVNLIVNIWDLKIYTATAFEKRERQPMLDKYFKEKRTYGMTRELVDEKSVTV
jgi:hypothetical protein